MSSSDRFKPNAPDVEAVGRLNEALPPEHPVHVFVDLIRSVELGYFVIPPGLKGEKPYHPHALFWGAGLGLPARGAVGAEAGAARAARGDVCLPGGGRGAKLP